MNNTKSNNTNSNNKNNNIIIRKETKEDYYATELCTLRAFWNIHGPGCNEHLMIHKLRDSKDYLPEISRVAELDGQIVGVIMYHKARIVDGDKETEIISFGPLAVEPTCFNMGIGGKLLKETLALAKEAGYLGIALCGEPDYYPKYGFLRGKGSGLEHNLYGTPDPFMIYPLNDGFEKLRGKFYEAKVFEECEDEEEIAQYTKKFPYYKPLELSCQWLHAEKLGRISEVQKNSYTIRFWEKEIPAKLKGSFYAADAKALPLVGDYVTFSYNPYGDSTILSVCERTGLLQRPDQAKTGVMQYMAANADYAFIVTSLNEDYSYNRIARYVSVALQGNVTPVVILTKADLCEETEHYVEEVRSISEKVRVHAISALYNTGMEELKEYFIPGTTICLLGSSGAGKSTLINALSGQEFMKTGEVRTSDSTGKHTTTYRRLFELENGVTIIDTPGMREIGIANNAEGVNETFSDIEEIARQCRFGNCRHDTEPGCAVRAAIEEGTLSQERYDLYLSLATENEKNHAKNNYEKKKAISKWIKAEKKAGKRIR